MRADSLHTFPPPFLLVFKGELPYLRLTSRHPLEAHLFYVVCQQRAEAKLG